MALAPGEHLDRQRRAAEAAKRLGGRPTQARLTHPHAASSEAHCDAGVVDDQASLVICQHGAEITAF
jgi:hypothetical protein